MPLSHFLKSTVLGGVAAASLLFSAATVHAQGRQLTPEDPVARINGQEILLADLITSQSLLPAQMAQQPFEALFPTLLNLVIEQTLFAEAGAMTDIMTDPGFQRELRFLTNRLLQDRYVGQLLEQGITQETYNAQLEALREELGPQVQAEARHILISDKENTALAQELIQRLNDGEDFATLAQEYSDGPSGPRGGALGVFGRGMMVPPFEAGT